MLKFWKQLNILYERLLLILLFSVFGIVLWCMYDNWYVFSFTLDGKIQRYKPGSPGAVAPEESPISDDMVAWITIDGTNIDYPVMQGRDNVRYLNTDPFGSYSLTGSIYLDFRNSPNFSDPYSLIYGHHMEYGKMFGSLDSFLNPAYLEQHKHGELIIGKDASAIYSLEVFAALRVPANDESVFDPGNGMIRETITSRNGYKTGNRDERIIGLSTCAEAGGLSRTVVFCYILE